MSASENPGLQTESPEQPPPAVDSDADFDAELDRFAAAPAQAVARPRHEKHGELAPQLEKRQRELHKHGQDGQERSTPSSFLHPGNGGIQADDAWVADRAEELRRPPQLEETHDQKPSEQQKQPVRLSRDQILRQLKASRAASACSARPQPEPPESTLNSRFRKIGANTATDDTGNERSRDVVSAKKRFIETDSATGRQREVLLVPGPDGRVKRKSRWLNSTTVPAPPGANGDAGEDMVGARSADIGANGDAAAQSLAAKPIAKPALPPQKKPKPKADADVDRSRPLDADIRVPPELVARVRARQAEQQQQKQGSGQQDEDDDDDDDEIFAGAGRNYNPFIGADDEDDDDEDVDQDKEYKTSPRLDAGPTSSGKSRIEAPSTESTPNDTNPPSQPPPKRRNYFSSNPYQIEQPEDQQLRPPSTSALASDPTIRAAFARAGAASGVRMVSGASKTSSSATAVPSNASSGLGSGSRPGIGLDPAKASNSVPDTGIGRDLKTGFEVDQATDPAAEARQQRLLEELRRRDRADAMDIDMGFGGGVGDEDEDEDEGEVVDWDGKGGSGGSGGGKKRKRSGKKKKENKDNVDDVMAVLAGRKR